MTIGQNIRRLRTEAGLSQAELARMIGKTRSMISQYESDMNAPRMGTVEKLAAALRCSKSEIIEDRGTSYTYTYVDLGTDERRLVALYRAMNSRDKAVLMQMADTLSRGAAESAEGVA